MNIYLPKTKFMEFLYFIKMQRKIKLFKQENLYKCKKYISNQ